LISLHSNGRSFETSRIVDGVSVPAFFYGTAWKEERTKALTASALAAGFRAIDTANQRRHYFEAGVGEALGSLARDAIFLQTKFTYARGQDHRKPYDRDADLATQVGQSMDSSLHHLGTPYVDSFLLHGPSAGRGISADDREVWRAMGELQRAGKTRLLGVSNVSVEQLDLLIDVARAVGAAKPSFVQNRCYARTGWDREVRALCHAHGIAYQGFSLLTANRTEIASPELGSIARRTGRTLPQVVFRFAMQVGMIPLTGTSSPAHMREDLACFEFDLSPADIASIERVGQPG
jgi:diketogulonate reductase-like aldo/keto reductase